MKLFQSIFSIIDQCNGIRFLQIVLKGYTSALIIARYVLMNCMHRYPLLFPFLASVILGMLFPLVSIVFLLFFHHLPLTLHSIIQIHQGQPLLFIIWSAPFVLGLLGLLLGQVMLSLKKQMLLSAKHETELETIFDAVANAIVTIDSQGKITNFNQIAETMFGYRMEEVVGNNVKILMPEEIAQQHDAYLARCVEQGDAKVLDMQREVEAKRSNGELFPALLKVTKMVLQGELFFIGIVEDISEDKALLEQLNQAQKMEAIGQLASGIAHEINTPVQYIGDNIQALMDNFKDLTDFITLCKPLDDASDQEKQQWQEWADEYDLAFILEDSPVALQQSLEGIDKVSSIVKAMKAFAYTDGKQSSVININELLKNTLIIAKNEYKYIADTEINLDEQLPLIECYPNELNQVFVNLIVNAAHAIEEKGKERGLIRISSAKKESAVIIAIQDTGIGIPENIRKKVFNLFFTTKQVGKGTGQGLSIAHSIIVDKHHGKFYFESEEHVGTTFYIELPAEH